MNIENRPEFQAARIQRKADGHYELPLEHDVMATESRNKIMALIALSVVSPMLRKLMPDMERGCDDQ